MNTLAFWLLATLMAAVTLAWLLRPLLSRPQGLSRPPEVPDNLALLREQHTELQADHREGLLDDAEHRRAQAELARRTLDETPFDAVPLRPATTHTAPAWRTAAVLACSMPLLAATLYSQIGRPDTLSASAATLAAAPDLPTNTVADPAPTAAPGAAPDVEAMVSRLAQRLQTQPDDAPGWIMLAHSYTALGRFSEASQAYARAAQLTPDDPQLLADQADALAMAQGRSAVGEPTRLIERALQIAPTHLKALAMAASAALERGDLAAAQGYFQRARDAAPAGSALAADIDRALGQFPEAAPAKPPAPP